VVILGSIWMLHSQASLVNLLKNKNISSGIFYILLYHLVCWLGLKSSKVQTKEKKHGDQDYNKYDYRDHVSTVADIYISACSPYTGSDQPSPLRKLKESLK